MKIDLGQIRRTAREVIVAGTEWSLEDVVLSGIQAYHRQIEERLLRVESHQHIIPGEGQLKKTGTAIWCSYLRMPSASHIPSAVIFCNCEGRKKLEDEGYLWQEDGGLWVRATVIGDGTRYVEDCPLCDKPLP